MKEDNIIKDKSFAFAMRIVKLYNYLTKREEGICAVKASYSLWHEHRGKYQRSVSWADQAHVCSETKHCSL